jgi:hypothetical protein
MKKPTYTHIAILAFVLPLVCLLANDHYFKYTSPNFITGKLSDIAGLTMWSVFFMSIFPRHTKITLVATIVLFTFWKSPYAQYLIDTFKSATNIKLHRTVDYTDLWALLIMLPVYARKTAILKTFTKAKQTLKYVYATVVVFAICATSLPDYTIFPKYGYENTNWNIPIGKRTLFEKTLGLGQDKKTINGLLKGNEYQIFVYESFSKVTNRYKIRVKLDSLDQKTCKLRLDSLFEFDNGRSIKEFTKERFVSIFEDGFIRPVSTKDSVKIEANYTLLK